MKHLTVFILTLCLSLCFCKEALAFYDYGYGQNPPPYDYEVEQYRSFNFNYIVDACLNKNSNLEVCEEILQAKNNLEREANRLLVQNLSISQRYFTTIAYFAVTQRIIFSWKIDHAVNVNFSYDFHNDGSKQITFSYSF